MRRFAFENNPTYKGHSGRITALAFSNDGSLLASGSGGNPQLFIWSTQDGALVRSVSFAPCAETGATPYIGALAFSSDGHTLYAVSSSGLSALSPNSGELMWHRELVYGEEILLSPTGSYALYRDYEEIAGQLNFERRLRLLHLANNQFSEHSCPPVHPYEVSQDGYLFFVQGSWLQNDQFEQRPAKVYEVATGDLVFSEITEGRQCLIELFGRHVLCRVERKQPKQEGVSRLELLDVRAGIRQVRPVPDAEQGRISGTWVRSIPGTSKIVVVGSDCEIVDANDPEFCHRIPRGGTPLEISRDGKWIALSGESGDVLVFETLRWTLVHRFPGFCRPIESLAVSLDSRHLAVGVWMQGTLSPTVHLWDLHTLELIGPMIPDRRRRAWHLRNRKGEMMIFDRDLRWLGVAGSTEYRLYQSAVQIGWFGPQQSSRRNPNHDAFSKTTRTLSSNGKWLGVAEEDKAILVNVQKGFYRWMPRQPSTNDIYSDRVLSTSVSGDGRKLAVGRHLYEVYDFGKNHVWSIYGGDAPIAFAFSPVGNQAAVGDGYSSGFDVRELSKRQRPRDVRRRSLNQEVAAHSGSLRAVTYTPDGRFIISAGADGQIILRHAGNLIERATLRLLSPMERLHPLPEWIAYTPKGEFNGSPGVERWFVGSGEAVLLLGWER